jgi:hypothetical protein
LKEALNALNSLKQTGVVEDYAIGGAIAASFYIEAVNTEDVDAFLFMSPGEGTLLLSLTPIYDALKKLGGIVEEEYVRLGEWPVQILPAYKPLVEEAIKNAASVKYGDIATRIFTPEFLCAIALDTGRLKDYYRVASFIEQRQVNMNKLRGMVKQYGLEDRTKNVLNWNQNEAR